MINLAHAGGLKLVMGWGIDWKEACSSSRRVSLGSCSFLPRLSALLSLTKIVATVAFSARCRSRQLE